VEAVHVALLCSLQCRQSASVMPPGMPCVRSYGPTHIVRRVCPTVAATPNCSTITPTCTPAQVVVPLPDEEARAAILAVHLRRVPLASQHDRDLACEAVAKITAGAIRGMLWVPGGLT